MWTTAAKARYCPGVYPASADYQLAWPRDLFVGEAELLLSGIQQQIHGWTGRVLLLLDEAFAGPGPRDEFEAASAYGLLPEGADRQGSFLQELVDQAPSFPDASTPKPYWPDRQGDRSPSVLRREVAQRRFIAQMDDFSARGYLERVFPDICVDDHYSERVNESDLLEEKLGVAELWPLESSKPWEDDLWFGLIEVFHDLVARPRTRQFHDYGGCGWHYSDFALEPARRLYRWKINQLLDQTAVPLQLASEGEDVGRLVATTDEARAHLLEELITNTNPSIRDRVRHAIALFRSRAATSEDKRSAAIALAGVLEERRPLLKEGLFRKDEGALFEIANGFAIRHQNASQKSDYDPVFLDWVFWWYAATVELTERLIQRSGQG